LGLLRAHEHEARRRRVRGRRAELEQVVEPAQGGVVDLAGKGVVGARLQEQAVERGRIERSEGWGHPGPHVLGWAAAAAGGGSVEFGRSGARGGPATDWRQKWNTTRPTPGIRPLHGPSAMATPATSARRWHWRA